MAQQRDKAMPIVQFRSGLIEAGIWRNEIATNDQIKIRHSVRLEKQFKTSDGSYKTTNHYFPHELPQVILLLQRCYEYINKIDGNTEFQTGQALYCDASFDDALEHFTQARLYYIEAGDCFGEDICDTVIDTCTFGDATIPETEEGDDGNGGGIRALDMALIAMVLILIGAVVVLIRR